MASKIRAAVAARRDPGFVVVARTDARSVEGFDSAVDRARRYLDAGADMIFPEALESAEEFARFAEEVPGPLLANLTEFGRGPLLRFDELAGLGYRAVLYPLTAFRAAMKAAEDDLDPSPRSRHPARSPRPDADAGRALRPPRLRGLGSPRPGLFRRLETGLIEPGADHPGR